MVQRHGVPAARIAWHVLPNASHGIGREPAARDCSQLAAWLWQMCEHARAGECKQSLSFKRESA
jgi:hypothetical protein